MKISMLHVALGTLLVRSLDSFPSFLCELVRLPFGSSWWYDTGTEIAGVQADFDENTFKLTMIPKDNTESSEVMVDSINSNNAHAFLSAFAESAPELPEDALFSLNELRKSVMTGQQQEGNHEQQGNANDENMEQNNSVWSVPDVTTITTSTATTGTISQPMVTTITAHNNRPSVNNIKDLYALIDQYDAGEVEELEVETACNTLGLNWENFKTLFEVIEQYKAGNMEKEEFDALTKLLGFHWNS